MDAKLSPILSEIKAVLGSSWYGRFFDSLCKNLLPNSIRSIDRFIQGCLIYHIALYVAQRNKALVRENFEA